MTWVKETLRVNLLIVGLYGAVILSIFVRSGEPEYLWWWGLMIPFFLWCISPIFIPLVLARRSWLVSVGIALLAIVSLNQFIQNMFGEGVRSTSSLIFIFLPVYQWLAAAILLGIYFFMKSKTGQTDE